MLHFLYNIQSDGIRLFNGSTTTGSGVALTFQTGVTGGGAAAISAIRAGSELTDLAFFAGTVGAVNEVLRIANNRNVGIGTTSPNAAAILELSSTSKGFLTSRMTKAQRDAISSPPDGLLIYQTDNTPGFRYRENGAWVKLTTVADP